MFKLLDEGETAAYEMARKSPKLSEELVDWLKREKADYDAALVEIEQVQVVGYLARKLQKPFDIDYSNLVEVLRLVRNGALGEARDYLQELGKDTVLADEAHHLWSLYSHYQRVHADNGLAAQFLANLVFEQHYNARAALVRAVLNNELDAARTLTSTIPALPAELIDIILGLREQTGREREEVWALGGLHVVGSERHESRRIDNQLRGRAGRQGDPGSSRFFLSIEDELMRRFGGERLKSWMNRGMLAQIPDDMPLEFGVLDRLIENAQERVEGYNFDIRKNVVEYDDVMNKQRQAIYNQRQAILLGELSPDKMLEGAFENAIGELVDNYTVNYEGFVREEIERVVTDFTTESTDDINLTAVVARLRGLLPEIVNIDKDELAALNNDRLIQRLMTLVYENEQSGYNLYQLLQAMGRFLPLLPPIPNLGSLVARRSGQMQAKENIRRDFISQVESFYNEFLVNQVDLESQERETIWNNALDGMNKVFNQFSVDGLSVKTAPARQARFKSSMNETLRAFLLANLSALDSNQLVVALKGYIEEQKAKWRKHVGEEEFENFQRLLVLDAIDREWRDYLTAVDDLRREIGLEAIGQRDPKVQFKLRSSEMFQDMRNNIDKDLVDRYFRQIVQHEAYIRQEQQEVAYKVQARDAGFQAVKREKGKGVELRRDLPKVGRNDLCPCGSGKKYKNCHMRDDLASEQNGASTKTAVKVTRTNSRKKKKRRR
jgi:preprotein translocase subunit SecA